MRSATARRPGSLRPGSTSRLLAAAGTATRHGEPAPTGATAVRQELRRIGSNLNQACRRLHALDGDNAAAVAAVEHAADAVGRFLEAMR